MIMRKQLNIIFHIFRDINKRCRVCGKRMIKSHFMDDYHAQCSESEQRILEEGIKVGLFQSAVIQRDMLQSNEGTSDQSVTKGELIYIGSKPEGLALEKPTVGYKSPWF